MIAGAGTMTSLLSLRAEFYVGNIIIAAIIINILFVYIILKSSELIERILRKIWNCYYSKSIWNYFIGYRCKIIHIQHRTTASKTNIFVL